MTLPELRDHYAQVYRMLAEGRRALMAGSLVGGDEIQTECDQALASLVAMKDELKARIAPAVQDMLIDVPETKKPIGGY